jgi:hypothetical protein
MSTQQMSDNQSCFQHELARLVSTQDAYYVELSSEALDDQGHVLDALINFTFDTLNIQHLDLRIVAEAN